MSEKSSAIGIHSYPGYIGTEPRIACSVQYDWGSLRITEAAMETYGLAINTDAGEQKAKQSQLRYSADILIAGPQEIRQDNVPEALVFRYNVNRGGVRATLGSTIDKDIAGVDMASRLISAMASELPDEEQPVFLMEHGGEIQDAVKDYVPTMFPHYFAHVTSKIIQDSFEKWATQQAARNATSAINRASALAILGTGIINGHDWLGDGNIEGTTALFSLGYVGYLAMKARSEIKFAIKSGPAVTAASRLVAESSSKAAERDIHNLLCEHGR